MLNLSCPVCLYSVPNMFDAVVCSNCMAKLEHEHECDVPYSDEDEEWDYACEDWLQLEDEGTYEAG